MLDDNTKKPEFASTVTPTQGLKANMRDNYLERELVGLLQFSHGRELQGHWGSAIKSVGNYVKENGKTFKCTLRCPPLLYALNNGLGSETTPTQNESKGFKFIHIQADVPVLD
ncbi:hypothetical protein [Rossellomorea aquimaris]|uniref:hypothetical protein n=1 Tax=Rossellomorea aquimaris TaxID=189382 RepID=UPI0005CA18E1|nr:hypothetical protein [Rossellomorea aquimaris]